MLEHMTNLRDRIPTYILAKHRTRNLKSTKRSWKVSGELARTEKSSRAGTKHTTTLSKARVSALSSKDAVNQHSEFDAIVSKQLEFAGLILELQALHGLRHPSCKEELGRKARLAAWRRSGQYRPHVLVDRAPTCRSLARKLLSSSFQW